MLNVTETVTSKKKNVIALAIKVQYIYSLDKPRTPYFYIFFITIEGELSNFPTNRNKVFLSSSTTSNMTLFLDGEIINLFS